VRLGFLSLALLVSAGCGSVYDAAGLRALGPPADAANGAGTPDSAGGATPAPVGATPDPGGGTTGGTTGGGGGLTCAAGTVACGTACVVEDAQHCGASCVECPAPFAGTTPTCDAGTCGHACAPGRLSCAGGCCQPARVTAGASHTCAIARPAGAATFAAGELLCWGANDAGQLGTADGAQRAVPKAAGISDAAEIAAGGAHTCVLHAGGAVDCFGDLAAPAGITAVRIATGAGHACALSVAGAVACWTASGPSAALAPSVPGASLLAAGNGFTCAASAGAAGQVQCVGTLTTSFSLAATALVAGDRHACAATSGGPVCWGANEAGQLGTGASGTGSTTPVSASRLPSQATVLAAGGAFTCAGKPGDTSLKCGGADDLGQSGGMPGTAALPSALDVTVGGPLVALAAGVVHVCAIAGTELWCWGANDRGQSGRTPAASVLPGAIHGP